MAFALPPSPAQLIQALFSGLLLGVTLALPLGPIAVEVLRNSMRYGFWMGLAVGTGAIIADGFYLLIVQFGLVPLLEQPVIRTVFGLVSTVILLLLGYSLFRPGKQMARATAGSVDTVSESAPSGKSSPFPLKALFSGESTSRSKKQALLNGMILTGLNPFTLTLWIGVGTTAVASWNSTSPLLGIIFIFGILFGQEIWFAAISRLARTRFFQWQMHILPKIQKAFGLLMIGLALVTLYWTVIG
ncbi:LysE family transporter [Heliobacterium gestii]|uniref:LysE family transporter n=1 Tax=Heliomicrobium gestii TaxID=2699 RepID=A0A845LCY3_HELGE|nr:LysE family transporter [Heliomicrobium gestii]MBM7866175.1 threonine/homoserine/homoserine lactone efflux protein [Heliomicrobium gestii]MZP42499.1 LysE family transporter [Heliomicrobium gestii]